MNKLQKKVNKYYPMILIAVSFAVSVISFEAWGNKTVLAQSVVCEAPEYACWGRNVPIKKIRCDEVIEREVCDNDICGDDCCPDDDPLTSNDESDCTCCCTQYSCDFCKEGRIFPWPERPEGGHGDADKCPTGEDLGQMDGTGLREDPTALWYDYDSETVINIPPIQFGAPVVPPSPTPTPTYGVTPEPTTNPDTITPLITVIATGTATPTPTGPAPTGGWPTQTPTPIPPSNTPVPTPTPNPTLPPDLDAPCGWPLSARNLGFVCPNGDYPEDANNDGNGNHGYNSMDIIAEEGDAVTSRLTGTAYRCVDTTDTVEVGTSYGVYVIVIGGNGWKTMNAHLSEETGDTGGVSGYPCLGSDKLVRTFAVGVDSNIGTVGMTGGTNWPHTHYEIWQGNIANPIPRVCPANFMDYTAQACGGTEPNAYNNKLDIFAGLSFIRDILHMINPFNNEKVLASN